MHLLRLFLARVPSRDLPSGRTRRATLSVACLVERAVLGLARVVRDELADLLVRRMRQVRDGLLQRLRPGALEKERLGVAGF